MQSALLGDHEVLGWIAFTLCLVPFFYVASHIESIDRILPPLPVREEEPALPGTKWFVVFGLATFAAISGPAWYKAVKIYPIEGELTASVHSIQSTLVKYPRQPAWQPAFRNVDERLVLQFVGKSASIQVHIVSYFTQHQGKELIQWGNHLADGDRWKLTARKIIDGPYQYPLNLAKIKSNTRRAEVIYWYAVGKYFTNSALRAKWYQFLSYLQGREDASLLAIYYLCPSDDCTETRQQALDAAPGVTRLYAQAINELLMTERGER
jgi:EpsI family protein